MLDLFFYVSVILLAVTLVVCTVDWWFLTRWLRKENDRRRLALVKLYEEWGANDDA